MTSGRDEAASRVGAAGTGNSSNRQARCKAQAGEVRRSRSPGSIKSHSQQGPNSGTMAQNMAHECANSLAGGRVTLLAKIQLAPVATGARQDANRLEVTGRQRDDVRLAGPAGFAENSTAREPEGHLSPLRPDVTAALSALIERRHHSQLTQARQLEPKHPPRAQSRVAQMPQGDPCRVEQLGVRVVEVRQIGQQFGDVVAGIQGRKIAAKRWKTLDGRGLSQQLERLGRFREDHHIGNAQEVKATLKGRLEPTCPFGQERDLPQIAREHGRDRARLEDVNRSKHQGQGPDRGHNFFSLALSSMQAHNNWLEPLWRF
jgi:hypothetical protein